MSSPSPRRADQAGPADQTKPTDPAAKPTDQMASLWGSLGSHVSWAKTVDRSARTAPARAAAEQRFLDLADGDPVRAAHLRAAHYKRMALRSVAARRARRAQAGQ